MTELMNEADERHEEASRAERLEADCRQAMAALHPATWEHRAERRDDLDCIDCLLDEWLGEVR